MDQISSIVTWNIANVNGLLGKKSDDPDFINLIRDYPIICLQETVDEVIIPGFHSYSDLRTEGRNGGVTTLINSRLNKNSSIVKLDIPTKRSMNVIAIKMSNISSRDLFVINVYIPPSNSKRKVSTTDSETNFEILHSIIDKLANLGEVVICGDLNARIGTNTCIYPADNSADFIDLPIEPGVNNQLEIPANTPISTRRNSKDAGVNAHKKPFIDLVCSNNLLILNGRCIGDSAGNYTCFKWNGNSVVDYFICSGGVTPGIKSLTVRPHTIFSDHNPVVLSFWSKYSGISKKDNVKTCYENAPFRYKIDSNALNSFKEALDEPLNISKIDRLNNEADICASTIDVKNLCNKTTDLINNIASQCFEKSKNPTTTKPKHNAWFDKDCRSAKRLTNKSARIVNKHPDNNRIKQRHRENMKSYRNLIKTKKDRFFKGLNSKIKNGKIISWKDLKKLKNFTKSEVNLDDKQIGVFQNYYKELYSDEHSTVDHLTKAALLEEADTIASSSNPNHMLNDSFSMHELDVAIVGLKNGKASSFDHIPNELIRALNGNFRKLLLNLFNLCLSTGSYFWSSSVITPLHKKGSIQDPDNYRAIAVCSCIGKLFATMLLNRLIKHRSVSSPDPPNQCGFTKGSQCDDHIFTLHTILEKYKRVKKKVYTVFIDMRKAFDMICRQALLFKLACYGVNGGFFNVLKTMYSDSSGHIKMNGKVSNLFSILKGTEQGHPLSPELFKVYFKELSDLLNAAVLNCPTLSGVSITHLAWADDLVIMALDMHSLQKQLDIIQDYCNKWGLEININKTKFMIMNSRKQQQSSIDDPCPTLNDVPLDRVYSYCYLGIIISSNGNFKNAVDSLCLKGLRALFSLRRTLDRRYVDANCHDQLFNMLVSPILTYGCQIWLPVSPVINSLSKCAASDLSRDKILNLFAKQPYERIHLRHLKYLLGINRRSSNAATWGDTGKYPIIIKCVRLSINYFKRITHLPVTNFTRAALTEQINLDLPWFKGIKQIIISFDELNPSQYEVSNSATTNALALSDLCSSSTITKNLQNLFTNSWSISVHGSSKLKFYSSVKSTFGWEDYLSCVTSFKERQSTARIRCSSHKLNIEVGRYNQTDSSNRICNYCFNTSGISTIEDEEHVLVSCPVNDEIRQHYLKCISKILDNNNDASASEHIDCYSADFNIASTYPAEMNVTASDNTSVCSTRQKIIRLACRTIHRLYTNTLQYKEEPMIPVYNFE